MRAGGIAMALLLAACGENGAPAEDSAPSAAASPVATPAGRYAPRDECAALPGLAAFRGALAAAVEARDAQALAVLADEDIKLDFGDGAGRAELLARLDRADSELWPALDELLALGCAAGADGGITLPWYFAQDIPVDPYDGMIVTGEGVPLLPSADASRPPLATVDWDAVELVAGFYPDRPFQQVRFGERQGYIATDKLRSMIDYRLIASQEGGTWRIAMLIAGD